VDALVIILILAAVAAVVIVLLRRQAAREAAASAAPAARRDPMAAVHGNEDDLHRLKVGDVVHYEGRDFLVRGSLRFDERGYTWEEHLMSDGEVQHWLSVEDDEGISVVLWQRIGKGELDGEPGSQTVRHGGISYSLHEDGEATFVAEGTTGTAPSGTARYADYRGPEGRMLSCERFGQTWEVSVGHAVLPRTLDVFPVTG
jgi:hypothetical protein